MNIEITIYTSDVKVDGEMYITLSIKHRISVLKSDNSLLEALELSAIILVGYTR